MVEIRSLWGVQRQLRLFPLQLHPLQLYGYGLVEVLEGHRTRASCPFKPSAHRGTEYKIVCTCPASCHYLLNHDFMQPTQTQDNYQQVASRLIYIL